MIRVRTCWVGSKVASNVPDATATRGTMTPSHTHETLPSPPGLCGDAPTRMRGPTATWVKPLVLTGEDEAAKGYLFIEKKISKVHVPKAQ